jgi:hypothetical protein
MADITSYVAELDFLFDDETPIDSQNPVLSAKNISGDATFYENVGVVINNLKQIRASHPSIGLLVSFAQDSTGANYKVTLA